MLHRPLSPRRRAGAAASGRSSSGSATAPSARLIEQHLRLVLQRGHLIGDLLQLMRAVQHVLDEVRPVEHGPLRVGGGSRRCEHDHDGACRNGDTQRTASHWTISALGLSMSAAQASPLRRSQAAANPACPCSPSSAAMAA